jgi:hypothetical protein
MQEEKSGETVSIGIKRNQAYQDFSRCLCSIQYRAAKQSHF